MLWPGSHPVGVETVTEIDTDGSFGRVLSTPEHAGTHLDAPAHFVAGGRTVDAIEAGELVLEAAVIDARDACARDPDHVLEAAELEAFEAEHGRLPAGGALLLCTGWDRNGDDPARQLGGDDAASLHFPGFGPSAAALAIERGVAAIGVDTVSVDAGVATSYPVHRTTLPADVWHLEGLVNLDRLPPRGATVVIGVLPLAGGSGAPARVLALLGA
ncbi:MAG: cyclase family protein [Solirubrobacterales bacterium]|nr:cyclase family protein [Solirubrobacterales bacterium]